MYIAVLGTDERNCPGQCRADEFKCNITGQCIPAVYICDGRADCVDGSDEDFCHKRNSCTSDQQCSSADRFVCNSDTGKCECMAGYALQMFSGKCEDVDECRSSWVKCQQKCVNQNGSYTCRCGKGFYRRTNKHNNRTECLTKGGVPSYLLIAAENEILISNHNGSYDRSYPESDATQANMKISGLDVHLKLRLAFITNAIGENPSIQKYPLSNHLQNMASTDDSLPRLRRHVNSLQQIGSSSLLLRRRIRSLRESIKHLVQRRDTSDPLDNASVDETTGLEDLNIEGLVMPVDVAVDWVADRVYWLDAGKHTLSMAELDGSNKTTIINTNLGKPGALAIGKK